jgi:hypothetical protein
MTFKTKLQSDQSKKEFSTNFETNLGVTDQDVYEEMVYSGSKLTSLVGYKDSSKAVTLYSQAMTYSQGKVSQISTVIHNPDDNTMTKTVTDTLTYQGSRVQNIARAVT